MVWKPYIHSDWIKQWGCLFLWLTCLRSGNSLSFFITALEKERQTVVLWLKDLVCITDVSKISPTLMREGDEISIFLYFFHHSEKKNSLKHSIKQNLKPKIFLPHRLWTLLIVKVAFETVISAAYLQNIKHTEMLTLGGLITTSCFSLFKNKVLNQD